MLQNGALFSAQLYQGEPLRQQSLRRSRDFLLRRDQATRLIRTVVNGGPAKDLFEVVSEAIAAIPVHIQNNRGDDDEARYDPLSRL
jgi:hypothetical protein